MIYTIYISPSCVSLPAPSPLSLAVPVVWAYDSHGEEAGHAQVSGRKLVLATPPGPWTILISGGGKGVKIPACQN